MRLKENLYNEEINDFNETDIKMKKTEHMDEINGLTRI
jgi:hypothetical protein